MYLIVIYDIKQEENYTKRQRYVFKTCKKYLIEDIDSCIIFSARNNVWMKKDFITRKLEGNDQFI
ncbi:MAG TPA: CRISPR-associated endonuclease Cas2 [[Clostridium] spiroforme]|uniref:CRISPR-associated endonuclease Cas2 n=1 Tax=Thomasclavelia spiroformis TaxID=29348 RepID=A0A921KJA6_9FIRM|nr:CRISPR-associated endonuclease Cas2 [Thomasclavelia spiroformis]